MTGFNLLLQRYLTDLLDLEAWWPLNDGGAPTAQDYSLHRTHGAVIGCIAADDFCGQVDNAFYFDGVNDRVVATTPQLDFTSTDFSIVARLRAQTVGVDQYIYCRGFSNTDGLGLYIMISNRLFLWTAQPAAGQATYTGINTIAINTWYTVGISREGANIDIYVNGADVTFAHDVHINPTTSARPAKVGIYDDLTSLPFHGRICDFKAYSRALTPAQHLAAHQRYCVHPPR